MAKFYHIPAREICALIAHKLRKVIQIFICKNSTKFSLGFKKEKFFSFLCRKNCREKRKIFFSFFCENIWESPHSHPRLDLRIEVEDLGVVDKLDVSVENYEPNLGGLIMYGDLFKTSRIQENLWYNLLFLFYIIMWQLLLENFCSIICSWDPVYFISIKLFDWLPR